MTVSVRSYLSPTLVLLAFDWPDASWAQRYFVADSPEAKARVALASQPTD